MLTHIAVFSFPLAPHFSKLHHEVEQHFPDLKTVPSFRSFLERHSGYVESTCLALDDAEAAIFPRPLTKGLDR
jgi:hypothetical protein